MKTTTTLNHDEVESRLCKALRGLLRWDSYLLGYSSLTPCDQARAACERSIAFRLGLYLQGQFPDDLVDCEYDKIGDTKKKTLDSLEHRAGCSKRKTSAPTSDVYPDIIVHKRGEAGPNLLALEMKKTTNGDCRECDLEKLDAYLDQLHYAHAAFVEVETREGYPPMISVTWRGPENYTLLVFP